MTQNNVTIEQLAERLGQTVWTKGDLKRIYLNDAGYNTKKMSTKTFIWQDENGRFQVSCKIECPSQGYQWIKSQEDEVKTQVNSEIENAIAQINAVLVDFKVLEETPGKLMVYVKDNNDAEAVWYTEDYFFTKFGCNATELFKSLPTIEVVAVQPTVAEVKPKTIQPIQNNTDSPLYGVNTKVSHKNFGIGTVVAENDTRVDVEFNSVGLKPLVKKFVKLEVVSA